MDGAARGLNQGQIWVPADDRGQSRFCISEVSHSHSQSGRRIRFRLIEQKIGAGGIASNIGGHTGSSFSGCHHSAQLLHLSISCVESCDQGEISLGSGFGGGNQITVGVNGQEGEGGRGSVIGVLSPQQLSLSGFCQSSEASDARLQIRHRRLGRSRLQQGCSEQALLLSQGSVEIRCRINGGLEANDRCVDLHQGSTGQIGQQRGQIGRHQIGEQQIDRLNNPLYDVHAIGKSMANDLECHDLRIGCRGGSFSCELQSFDLLEISLNDR
ncbi:MAG: hypothetical protein VKK98_05990 [Cyanobacteriota bacterium]|nr:hypothetical protein [Cyanobacteriota bacterium]